MKLHNISDIFFDLDHTLWDFDKNSALTFKKIFKQNNVQINLQDFLNTYEPINLQYWKLYRNEQIEKEALRYQRLRDSFEALKMPVTEDLIYKLSDQYIQHLGSFNFLFDGVFELLDYLKPNYKLHIITNGFQEVQQGKLEKAKIADYFLTVTNSEIAGVKKPNPIIFQYALDAATANKQTSVMIGDNLEADVLGAIDFGMEAICFNYHKNTIETKIKQVSNLLELKAFL